MLPAPALLLIGLVLALLVLLPARRLDLAGFTPRAIGLYATGLWALAFLLALRPVATRFLIPILLVAYLAPFVVAPGRMARIARRGKGGPPPPRDDDHTPPRLKNVTPPDVPTSRE